VDLRVHHLPERCHDLVTRDHQNGSLLSRAGRIRPSPGV
jgi:hypothetical protein